MPGHDHARAGAVRAGDRARRALAVEHRDVRGRAERRVARVGGIRIPEELLDERRVVEAGEELGRPLVLGPLHHLDDPLQGGRPGVGVEPRQRACDQDPAGRRRRVGEHRPAAVADLDRLAVDDRVRLEVLGGQHPSARRHPLDDRGGDVARVERRPGRRAPSRSNVSASSGWRIVSPARSSRPSGANIAAHSGVEVTMSREDLDHVLLRRASPPPRRARASRRARPGRPAASGRSGSPPRRSRAASRSVPTDADADVEHLDRVAERDRDRDQLRARDARSRAAPGRLDEEVEQRRPAVRASPPACSRRRRTPSAMVPSRTTRASRRSRRRPRCRPRAARPRPPRRSADGRRR